MLTAPGTENPPHRITAPPHHGLVGRGTMPDTSRNTTWSPSDAASPKAACPRAMDTQHEYRMIHAAYHQLAADMLTFEKAAARLPGVRVLDAASKD